MDDRIAEHLYMPDDQDLVAYSDAEKRQFKQRYINEKNLQNKRMADGTLGTAKSAC